MSVVFFPLCMNVFCKYNSNALAKISRALMYDYRQGLWACYLFCLLELVRGNGNYLINLPIQLV